MRIVSAKAKCKRTEHKLSWGSTGPGGPAGAPGAAGAAGAPGANGAGDDYSSFNLGLVALALSENAEIVVSKTIPAGSYFASAKAVVGGDAKSAVLVAVVCQLVDSANTPHFGTLGSSRHQRVVSAALLHRDWDRICGGVDDGDAGSADDHRADHAGARLRTDRGHQRSHGRRTRRAGECAADDSKQVGATRSGWVSGDNRRVIARYTRPELGRLWSDEARMDTWRRGRAGRLRGAAGAARRGRPERRRAAGDPRRDVHRRRGQRARARHRARRRRVRRRARRVRRRGRALDPLRADLLGRARHGARAAAARAPAR